MPQPARRRIMRTALVIAIGGLVLGALVADAAPADPFSGATAAQAPPAQDGADFNSGDWGISQENGAATYTYGIVVPPGRNGIQPALALRYSSQAPLRGGIAAGWSLDLPLIEPDLSLGVDGGTQYRATLGGASGRLVSVADRMAYSDAVAAYRVNFDAGYVRFFRRENTVIDRAPQATHVTWTALSSDGMRYQFTTELRTADEPRWLLAYQEDRFGNRVTYFRTPVFAPDGTFLEDRLDRIEYTSNAAANLIAHAKVEFAYAPLELCTNAALPVGAAMRRGGTSVDGAHNLTAINTFVRDTQAADWRPARRVAVTITLTNSRLYEGAAVIGGSAPDTIDCKQNLLRRLDQIDVTAYAPDGTPTAQPPLTFDYNNRIITTPELIVPGAPDPLAAVAVDWNKRGQTGVSGRIVGGQMSDLLDIDADGINDWATVTRTNADLCRLIWHKGLPGGGFSDTVRTQDLPTAAWHADWKGSSNPLIDAREGCTIGGQIAYRDYESSVPATSGDLFAKGQVSYHFIDYDADGKLDLVTNVWATVCHWTYDPYAPRNVSGDVCSFADARAAGSAAAPSRAGNEPPVGGVDFIAMTPEEVSAFDGVPGTNNHDYIWRIYRGTGDLDRPFETSQFLRASANPPLPLPPTVSDERLDSGITTSYAIAPLIDLDGDGFLDFIDTGDTTITDCQNEILLRECDWTVYFGDGTRNYPQTVAAYVWDAPVETLGSPETETATCGLEYIRRRASVVALVDMTGDGLPDLVVRDAAGALKYYRNTGGAFGAARSLGVSAPLDKLQTDCNLASNGNDLVDGARGYLRRLTDLDGDGLTDMIVFGNGTSAADITAMPTVSAHFNVGGVLAPAVPLPDVWQQARRLFSADYNSASDNPMRGTWYVAGDIADANGDGRADLVTWGAAQISVISSPGLPEAPDLLRSVRNGRGLTVTFDYTASSDPAAVACLSGDCADYAMPAVRWLATGLAVDGGFGQPLLRTTYAYGNPHTLSAAPISGYAEPASFAGFGAVNRSFSGDSAAAHRELRRTYAYSAINAAGATVAAPHATQTGEAVYELIAGQPVLRSYSSSTSAGYRLFDAVQVALPGTSLSCTAQGDSDTPAACLARADHVHRSERVWQPRAYRLLDEDPVTCGAVCSGAAADFYNLRTLTTGEGSTPTAGDVRISFSHSARYGQTILDDFCNPPIQPCIDTDLAEDDYMVQVNSTRREERGAADAYTLIGLATTAFSDATGLPTRTRLYRDATTYGMTTFLYDGTLGSMTALHKPAQQAIAGGSGAQTTYLYDDHALFVQQTTNELGHVVRVYHDVATGMPLRREGPNRIDPTSAEVVLEASADTYVSEAQPTGNFGNADRLIGGHEFVSGQGLKRLDTLIAFDLTPIAGKTVIAAQLRLEKITSPGSQYPITLSALRLGGSESWSETGATFNNYPGGPGPTGSDRCNQTIGGASGVWIWQCGAITSWVQGWNSGGVNNGIRITHPASFASRDAAPTFASREHANANLHPQLVVTVRSGPASSVYEAETWQIDGFGRVLTRSVTFDDAAGYVLVPIERHVYDDAAFFDSGAATSVTNYALRDRDGAVWLTTTNRLDGLGRTVQTSDLLDGGATADTVFRYSKLGTVARVTSPAPHVAGGTVEYRYAYDGLGRLRSTTRPDGTGNDYSYDGLISTITERTTDGSGGRTSRTIDARGRLIAVVEQAGVEGADALTRYAYDANNNLREIVDADGNVTTLAHDIASARGAITRAGRTWRYVYDFNGNLRTEQSPIPDGADPALYTTTFTYDDLDRTLSIAYADPQITSLPAGIPTATRLTSALASPSGRLIQPLAVLLLLALTLIALRHRRRAVAVALLTVALLAAGGVGHSRPTSAATAGVRSAANSAIQTIGYVYDVNQNGIGRLSSTSVPLGNATSQLVSTYAYDARGLPIRETRALALTGVATLNALQSAERRYNVLGALTDSTWHDGQQWAITYDARGLVDAVSWYDPVSDTLRPVADYTRSAAGLPTQRATDFDQAQTYGYDSLGRPSAMTVTVGASPLATRGYAYSDAGDLLTVTGHSDGLDAGATYQYDRVHRLTQADGPADYSASFSYSAAGNVLSADVAGGGEIATRHVSYSYGAADPQAVDALNTIGSAAQYGAFSYDAAGNMLTRTVKGQTTQFTWDAANQIRLAVTPGGSELYLYDDRGGRIAAVSAADGIRVWFAERESHYALDGTPQQTYLHLAGGGATLARVTDGTTIELQYADAQQNMLLALDAGGQIAARFLYSAFGAVIHADGAADHRRQFNGKEADAVTGLRYYGYRYYDPVLLRWNSADPLYRIAPDIGSTMPQRLNLYTFSLNNPVRYFDPDGRDADDGSQTDDQVCSVEDEVAECTLDPEGTTEEKADADKRETESKDSAVDEVVDGAIEAAKLQAGVSAGVANNQTSKPTKPKPSVAIGKSVSAIAVEGKVELGPGEAKVTLEALKAAAGAECSAAGCNVSASVELASIEACGQVCVPIPFTDYETCPGVCAGAGVGAGAEAGSGGFKFGAKAGIGGNVSVSIRKRRNSEEWTLYSDEIIVAPRGRSQPTEPPLYTGQ